MKYIIEDIFGNENEVSKTRFYIHKCISLFVVIGLLIAFIGILRDFTS